MNPGSTEETALPGGHELDRIAKIMFLFLFAVMTVC